MGACTPPKKLNEKNNIVSVVTANQLNSPSVYSKYSNIIKKDNIIPALELSPNKLDKTSISKTPDSFFLNPFTVFKTIILNKTEGFPIDFYDIIKPIGEGSYGKVYLVKEKATGIKRAMKEICREKPKPNQDSTNNINIENRETDDVILKTEIEVLRRIDHPNIIKIFEIYTTPENFYLITEYFNNSHLLDHIKKVERFSEEQSAFILFQILSAVNYLHFNKLIHRDIKPENIVISKIENNHYYLKLIDFGCCKDIYRNKIENKMIGSTFYLAPEVFDKKYSKKCDIWSIGVIFYILLCGELPFYGEAEEEIAVKIQRSDYDIEPLKKCQVSKEAMKLIKSMLELDKEKRITANKALKHCYFRKHLPKEILIANISKIKKQKLRRYSENIINFKPNYKIQYAALLSIVHHFIPYDEEVQEIQKLFYLFDDKNNGCLTADEIKKGLNKLLEEEIIINNNYFDYLDCNKKGYVQFKEFAIACLDKKRILNTEVIKLSFKSFDINSSGKVTLDDLKVVFGKKKRYTESTLEELMKEINNGGYFEFEEYKNILLNLIY